MTLTSGTRLGPYQMVQPLGAGGMGEVYKARDTRLDRTVAIKVLPSDVASDPDVRARFEREARAVAALDHPHICAIYDVGDHDGTHFIVMPHLDGETLDARLSRAKGPLPIDQAVKIAMAPEQTNYDVTAGGRFVIKTIVEDGAPSSITVVSNWSAVLRN